MKHGGRICEQGSLAYVVNRHQGGGFVPNKIARIARSRSLEVKDCAASV